LLCIVCPAINRFRATKHRTLLAQALYQALKEQWIIGISQATTKTASILELIPEFNSRVGSQNGYEFRSAADATIAQTDRLAA